MLQLAKRINTSKIATSWTVFGGENSHCSAHTIRSTGLSHCESDVYHNCVPPRLSRSSKHWHEISPSPAMNVAHPDTAEIAKYGRKAASLLGNLSSPLAIDHRKIQRSPYQKLQQRRNIHLKEPNKIRVISLDVSGTLLCFSSSAEVYHQCAKEACLPEPIPPVHDWKAGFREAFYEQSIAHPCYGFEEGMSGREWWRGAVRRCMYNAYAHFYARTSVQKDDGLGTKLRAGREVSAESLLRHGYIPEENFERFFRHAYQAYARQSAYMIPEDVLPFLQWVSGSRPYSKFRATDRARKEDSAGQIGVERETRRETVRGESNASTAQKRATSAYRLKDEEHELQEDQEEGLRDRSGGEGEKEGEGSRYCVGVLSNTSHRMMETVLPLTGIEPQIHWFLCSRDIGIEKPDPGIFDEAYVRASLALKALHADERPLQRSEIVHIGDGVVADYFGAKAAGFQALYLDRSGSTLCEPIHQHWLKRPKSMRTEHEFDEKGVDFLRMTEEERERRRVEWEEKERKEMEEEQELLCENTIHNLLELKTYLEAQQ